MKEYSHERSFYFFEDVNGKSSNFSINMVLLVEQRCSLRNVALLTIGALTICSSEIYREITMSLKKEGGRSKESKTCISTSCFLSKMILNV